MKCGDLVKIKEARIGVPAGTLGLIVERHINRRSTFPHFVYEIQLTHKANHVIKRLARDLEVVKCK